MYPEEIQSLIEILNSNKASGPDGISNKMLKPVAKEVSACLVVNTIIVDGYASLFNCTTAVRASDSMTASS